MKRIAILQSNYIPWKGYFDIARRVDEFVLYDDARFTRGDWRNRNRIKTAAGVHWLTIPADAASTARIRDVRAADPTWRRRHFTTLENAYSRAPHFRRYREALRELYLGESEVALSAINRRFLEWIQSELGIATPLRWSWEFDLVEGRNERLISICRQAGATEYLTGPAARAYLETEKFAAAGVRVLWMSYDGYREYPQLHGAFEHAVTALDLLFHLGPESPSYLLPLDCGGLEPSRQVEAAPHG